MNEIEKILKLLEEGKINADEAYRLIEAAGKREERERIARDTEVHREFSLRDIVKDSIKSVLSTIPMTIKGSLSAMSINEVIPIEGLEELELDISAGDVELKTSREVNGIKIKGSGALQRSGSTIKLVGDLRVLLPPLKKLTIRMNAGDLDAQLEGEEVEVSVKMGDADIRLSADSGRAEVNMGDMDLILERNPRNLKAICEMGDLNLVLPPDFDGSIETYVKFGSLEVDDSIDYRSEENRIIVGEGKASELFVVCNMGDVEITRTE